MGLGNRPQGGAGRRRRGIAAGARQMRGGDRRQALDDRSQEPAVKEKRAARFRTARFASILRVLGYRASTILYVLE